MDDQRRLLVAILLMIAVILATNLLFPPTPPPRPGPEGRDTVPADTSDVSRPGGETPTGGETPAVEEAPPETPDRPLSEAEEGGREAAAAAGEGEPEPAEEVPAALTREEAQEPSEDTVRVRSPLYEYAFGTRGAALVGARLLRYRSYFEGDSADARVELVRAGDRWLGFRVAVGPDTLDLRNRAFRPSAEELEVSGAGDSLVFRHQIGDTGLAFRVTYHFRPDSYLVDVSGRLEGIGDRGYTLLTSLGEGLRTNEATPDEDLGQLAYVVHDREGEIRSEKLSDVEEGEVRAVEGGPFAWVAVKNKYFLASFIEQPGESGFGGLLVSGVPGEHAAQMTTSLPVPAGRGEFDFEMFAGPQDYGRLTAIGQDLENVNPYGWQWLRPIIRPLVGLIMAILVWLHETLSLAYGWVLILFGVLMRVVLFPLYQKSMRAQMAQMQVQPLIKELQSKYKDDPQKLQKEMMRIYKEHNINPLAGCLPMLLPFPVLITLFFVFQNTIEFRGVPFLWLPDLSLKDPLYIIPVLMGLSMFLLQWIGQRGMERNTQMKVMGYGFPLVFTFLFMNFPSGLNLYYATSNFASLPQQLYLSKERRKARAEAPTPDEE